MALQHAREDHAGEREGGIDGAAEHLGQAVELHPLVADRLARRVEEDGDIEARD